MNRLTTQGIIFGVALLMCIPAIQMTQGAEAQARPGSILGESRQDGERSHNARRNDNNDRRSSNDRRRRSSRDSSNRNSSSSSRDSNSSSQARPTGPPRATGNVRPTQPQRQTRRDRRTTTRRGTSSSSRTTRVHTSSRTTVHHHHHHGDRRSSTRYQEPASSSSSGPDVDTYLTIGLGLSGFASRQITDLALPGSEFNLGLGVSGEVLGFELGFNGGGYTFNPDQSGLDIAVMGISGDFKVQPSVAIFEPYILAGVGGYHFQDAYLNEVALGGSFRVGAGLDLRFDRLALSMRYLRNYYGLANSHSFSGGLRAQTESLGANFTVYF